MEMLIAILAGGAVSLLIYGVISIVKNVIVPYERRFVSGTEKTLDGMFISLPFRNILYLSLGLGVILGLLIFLATGSLALAVVLAIVGFVVPKILINRIKNKRDEKFLLQLSDVLMSMSNSLKTGYSVPQAVSLIAREMEKPAGQEFGLAAQEMQMGTPVEEALGHIAQRMKSMEMDLFVASIKISRQVGGNLSEVMENISGTIRERIRVEGRVKALTAQGKIQGLVMCLMPFMLAAVIYLIQPTFIKPLLTTWAGYLLIFVVLIWMTVGALIVRKIVRIDI